VGNRPVVRRLTGAPSLLLSYALARWYVPRGVSVQSLNPTAMWEFVPISFREGQSIGPGDVFGTGERGVILLPLLLLLAGTPLPSTHPPPKPS